jgi:transposase-like protein
MEERGVSVDHSSINCWTIHFQPLIEKIARKRKRPVQFVIDGADAMSFADQFYALAKQVRSV